ncbi:uncharacterized protein LOC105433990 [Pogonomyrmex barbatus]|uniref:Uncharacterized protein LOC105433990 n=1 Tax=Pogonomyrmex barbatus TaxID=144034 RepID=A0A6I9XP31_9HYME|nr:uncharacterized protein LOC105433990 [Pogonomyrmex barbatus]
MKRSPLNNAAPGGRPYNARNTPYNWKSRESTNRGYQSVEGNAGYSRFSVSNGPQSCRSDDFIPLDVSTSMTRHDKCNIVNRYSPAGVRGNASPGSSGWYNNYSNNYHSLQRSNCNNRYSGYKHSLKQFHGQRKKGYRGMHQQINVLAYVDMNSFLEDPWKDLVKKLDDLRDSSKSEKPETDSLSNLKLTDGDLIEKSESILLKDANLNDSQCSQGCENEYSVDSSFATQSINLSQISETNSSMKSETDNYVCSSQDLLDKSVYSVNDTCEALQEKSNTHLNISLRNTDQETV